MLPWIRIEWLFLKGLWAWLTLTPKARTAVRNSSPQTWQRIDAILDARRERSTQTRSTAGPHRP